MVTSAQGDGYPSPHEKYSGVLCCPAISGYLSVAVTLAGLEKEERLRPHGEGVSNFTIWLPAFWQLPVYIRAN